MISRGRLIGGVALAVTLLVAVTMLPGGAQRPASKPAPAVTKFAVSKVRMERGRYLVQHVAHCFACHSETTWDKDGLPMAGREGAGQTAFPDYALPFKLVVPNITPDKETGSGRWDDAQFARAIREGIGYDGRRLFPIMPYMLFRSMSDEDVASIVVYVRSIPAVRNPLPKRQLPPEFEKMLPPPMPALGSVPAPDLSDPVKRGHYLVTLANCADCHTPTDEQFRPLPGMDFSGGGILNGPWGVVASANLTPDPSGISYYDEKKFLEVIRTGHVGARKLNQIMLWRYFRGMTDDDLKAIFAYLRTLKPVKHRVDNTEPVGLCKVCRAKHGGGGLN